MTPISDYVKSQIMELCIIVDQLTTKEDKVHVNTATSSFYVLHLLGREAAGKIIMSVTARGYKTLLVPSRLTPGYFIHVLLKNAS